jgi:5,10-methylene-tetrahydrofolate dehydrogenase/methenyl tetrahydrofolate cyclohydrolase
MLASLHLLYDSLVSCLAIFIGSLLPRIRVDPVDLTGKVAIVTGANSGIGYALALALAKQNATVYLACRNTSKAQKAANEIIDACGNSGSVHVVSLDTSSLAQYAVSRPLGAPVPSTYWHTMQASLARQMTNTPPPKAWE